jgi:membrane-associated phospholipid phosphatase
MRGGGALDAERRAPAWPLIPPSGRRQAAAVAACCATLAVIIAVLVAHSSQPTFLDRPVDSWLSNHFGRHTLALSEHVANVGGLRDSTIIIAVIAAACLALRRVNGAILAAVSGVAVAVLTEYVVKPLVHRTLAGFLVYPSGHTASAFTAATVITVLLLNPPRARPRRALTIAVAIVTGLAGCLVAAAMISLEFHYFTDAIGGAAFAIAVVLAVALGLDVRAVRQWLAAVPYFGHPAVRAEQADRERTPTGDHAV